MNEQSKGTPGPWGYDPESGEVYHNDKDEGDVCPVIVYVDFDNTSQEQADADGWRIARVPEMEAEIERLQTTKADLIKWLQVLIGRLDDMHEHLDTTVRTEILLADAAWRRAE